MDPGVRNDEAQTIPPSGHAREVFATFLKLGCTSFGGPIAHLGYFRAEIVERRRWLDDHAYGELVGLCQFLPGPASSQVGFALGLMRAGPASGLAAWAGFTLPSAFLMLAFATIAGTLQGPVAAAAIHGLKIAAVAIVAQALVGMARTLTPDLVRRLMAVVAAAAMLDFAPGSALLPQSPVGVIAWARAAASDPRVTLKVSGETDGTPADVDSATGSAAVLAADRARTLAAALAAAHVVQPGRFTIVNAPDHAGKGRGGKE